ncbi:MAG: prepilin-type N-terminal cleavage/methylation domain-containing protein [Armatimonadetes bacterium]|nr:prepilin-type N-terminal cleavage/methylation domain-containing protein [Armatimonadota bacterium]
MIGRQDLRFGFTLIELLVVIAIIAILAAILFPIFVSAKDAGKQAACAAIIKEVAAAVIMYADSSNGKMPLQYNYYVANYRSRKAPVNWMRGVYAYLKSYKMYVCPSSIVAPGHTADLNSVMGNGEIFQWIYPKSADFPYNASGYPTSMIRKSSGVVLVFCWKYQVNASNFRPLLNIPVGWTNATDPINLPGHNGGQNYAFVDGHVKFMTFDYVDENVGSLFEPAGPGKYRTLRYEEWNM